MLVAIDFIIKLSLSEEPLTGVKYNFILIIINRLLKEVRFILYKKSFNTKELVYKFLRNIIVI